MKPEIKITIGAARRVQEKLNVDLLNPAFEIDGATVAAKLLYSDLFLVSVITAIVEPQLVKADIDPREWEENLDGDALADLEKEFWTAYERFFTRRGKVWAAKALETDLQTKREAEQRALDAVSPGATSPDAQDAQESPTATDLPSGN